MRTTVLVDVAPCFGACVSVFACKHTCMCLCIVLVYLFLLVLVDVGRADLYVLLCVFG